MKSKGFKMFFRALLRLLRKTYGIVWNTSVHELLECENNADSASAVMHDLLMSDEPCMIARCGSTELSVLVNYLGIKSVGAKMTDYIRGHHPQWWWNNKLLLQLQNWSGFYPITTEGVEEFCEMMLRDFKEIDILGSWLVEEKYFQHLKDTKRLHLRLLEPFWSESPWTRALEGKRVLVIHPFDSMIESQFKHRRGELFSNKEILPDFKLQTIKAVQSLGGNCDRFDSWFSALEWMKSEIDSREFDIALIGAGAYGLPLAAYIKRQGKKSIHLGGALQLLFGIKGKRWEDPNYGVMEWGIEPYSYSNLMNEYWKRPNDSFRPVNAENVEGACYW